MTWRMLVICWAVMTLAFIVVGLALRYGLPDKSETTGIVAPDSTLTITDPPAMEPPTLSHGWFDTTIVMDSVRLASLERLRDSMIAACAVSRARYESERKRVEEKLNNLKCEGK